MNTHNIGFLGKLGNVTYTPWSVTELMSFLALMLASHVKLDESFIMMGTCYAS